MSLAPVYRQVGSFVAELTGGGPEVPNIACVDPVENAVDKISALIWRVPDRVRDPEDNDPDLVRHIHDLAILQSMAIAHPEFKALAIEAILLDEYRCEGIIGLPLEKKLDKMFGILERDKEYLTE